MEICKVFLVEGEDSKLTLKKSGKSSVEKKYIKENRDKDEHIVMNMISFMSSVLLLIEITACG